MWSRQSARAVRTQRSAKASAFGRPHRCLDDSDSLTGEHGVEDPKVTLGMYAGITGDGRGKTFAKLVGSGFGR
jgi:hypothetical protein